MHRESSLHGLLINFTQRMQMPAITAPSPHSTSTNPHLSLSKVPKATSIIPQLEVLGSSPIIAPKLSRACLRAAYDLRDACESSLRNAIQKQLADPDVLNEDAHTPDAWNIAHAQQTRVWAEAVFSHVRDIAAKAKSSAARPTMDKKKSVFNHEYTPLLEKYFEYNAYPSTLDRRVLARKSMMTPRQIEVWFQNHRNRARKDGKALRRLTEDPLPLEIPLKSLERKMPFFTIPEHERKPSKSALPADNFSDEEDLALTSAPAEDRAPTVFNSLPPLHAFPTLYPPNCNYDPFPCKTSICKFPSPVWSRRPAASCRVGETAINMDDFITEFDAKLHLRAPVSNKRHSKLAQSWCASKIIVLPPAPHPALVRPLISFPSIHLPRFPVVAAPSSRAHPFQSPSPFSQPTTLIPPRSSNNAPVRRKVASLPKRNPKSMSIAHCHHGPSRSPSFTSRSVSFGSEMWIDRRLSSSSSNSSSSSAPATPELPHTTLPDDGHSPLVSVSGIDNADDLFSDSRQSLSSEEAVPFGFSVAAQPKNPSTLSFEVPSAHRFPSGKLPYRSCVGVL